MSKVGEFFREMHEQYNDMGKFFSQDNDFCEWQYAMDTAYEQAAVAVQCLMTAWGIKYEY